MGRCRVGSDLAPHMAGDRLASGRNHCPGAERRRGLLRALLRPARLPQRVAARSLPVSSPPSATVPRQNRLSSVPKRPPGAKLRRSRQPPRRAMLPLRRAAAGATAAMAVQLRRNSRRARRRATPPPHNLRPSVTPGAGSRRMRLRPKKRLRQQTFRRPNPIPTRAPCAASVR